MAQASKAGGVSAGGFWAGYVTAASQQYRVRVSNGATYLFTSVEAAERHVARAIASGFAAQIEVL